ncbi:hypothetical protein GQ43DRAFT_29203 [Delitschia confertaspora ATCC 74209]|uniref:Uncharacterized protein n=1 Tax=Delitschia confertaspora ATCC 74209 TaxID=1513339 RepID=A0A9P4JLT4_9PLEO|nr:hypothetical protein GQ43DRAFT_29203 [Delitschia confertaspora ATCC 74209]
MLSSFEAGAYNCSWFRPSFEIARSVLVRGESLHSASFSFPARYPTTDFLYPRPFNFLGLACGRSLWHLFFLPCCCLIGRIHPSHSLFRRIVPASLHVDHCHYHHLLSPTSASTPQPPTLFGTPPRTYNPLSDVWLRFRPLCILHCILWL